MPNVVCGVFVASLFDSCPWKKVQPRLLAWAWDMDLIRLRREESILPRVDSSRQRFAKTDVARLEYPDIPITPTGFEFPEH